MKNWNSNPEETTADFGLSTIRAMCRQEESGYCCGGYMLPIPAPDGSCQPVEVIVVWRTKMVQWCFKIVDHCNFKRESVAIAMSLLDRFLDTSDGMPALRNMEAFQMAAITALYITIKTSQTEVMSSKLVSRLSRHAYSPEKIEAMERTILHALQWRINPPTALSFAFQFLQLLPETLLDARMKVIVFDIAKFQAELSIGEHRLTTVKQSVVAYSAILNALESVCFDAKVISAAADIISEATGVQSLRGRSEEVRKILFEAITEQSSCAAFASMFDKGQQQHSPRECATTGATNSPRSVMHDFVRY